MTHRRTWQKREQAAAKQIGALRNVGSGSQNRSDKSRSDSTHDEIYLECKHAARHAVITLWDDTHVKAKKEKKFPVVCLSVKHRPGRWYLVRSDHVRKLAQVIDDYESLNATPYEDS